MKRILMILAVGGLIGNPAVAEETRAYVGSGNLFVYDQLSKSHVETIDITYSSHNNNEALVDPATAQLYLSISRGNIVTVVDTVTNTETTTITVGQGPTGLALLPGADRLYVTSWGDVGAASVSVIDTTTNTVVSSIDLPVDSQPMEIEISADGSKAYVMTRANGGHFHIIDTTTNTIVDTAPLGLFAPVEMEMTPDGSRIYVSTVFRTFIRVFDTATNTKVTDIEFGAGTAFLAMSLDGTRLYAHSSSIRVIDTTTNTVVGTAPASSRTWGMQVSPDGSELWLALNEISVPDVVWVIDTATLSVKATLPAPFNPSAIAFTPVISVEIDIKPDSDDNTINLGSKGNIPVAILSSATFDATKIDPATVALANSSVKLKGKGTAMASIKDVNDDGRDDLVVHIDTTALELTGEDVEAVLTGKLETGQPFRGLDSVTIVKE